MISFLFLSSKVIEYMQSPSYQQARKSSMMKYKNLYYLFIEDQDAVCTEDTSK